MQGLGRGGFARDVVLEFVEQVVAVCIHPAANLAANFSIDGMD